MIKLTSQFMSPIVYFQRYTDFSLRYIAYIPTFKLGDKVEYKDIKNFPRKNYVVSRMIFDIDMNKIEVNVTFNGLDKKQLYGYKQILYWKDI